jgi:hypothetical protein
MPSSCRTSTSGLLAFGHRNIAILILTFICITKFVLLGNTEHAARTATPSDAISSSCHWSNGRARESSIFILGGSVTGLVSQKGLVSIPFQQALLVIIVVARE